MSRRPEPPVFPPARSVSLLSVGGSRCWSVSWLLVVSWRCRSVVSAVGRWFLLPVGLVAVGRDLALLVLFVAAGPSFLLPVVLVALVRDLALLVLLVAAGPSFLLPVLPNARSIARASRRSSSGNSRVAATRGCAAGCGSGAAAGTRAGQWQVTSGSAKSGAAAGTRDGQQQGVCAAGSVAAWRRFARLRVTIGSANSRPTARTAPHRRLRSACRSPSPRRWCHRWRRAVGVHPRTWGCGTSGRPRSGACRPR